MYSARGEVWCCQRGAARRLLSAAFFFFFSPDLFAEGAHVCTAACAVCLLPGMPRKREAF